MTDLLVPFRMPARICVRLHAWQSASDLPIAGLLRVWDATRTLELWRSFEVDGARLRSEAGLPPSAPLRLQVGWWCSETNSAGSGTRIDLPAEATTGELALQLDGRQAARKIEVAVRVVLSEAQPRRPITAWRAGTVLWETEEELALGEGTERFAVVPTGFKSAGSLPGDALWALHWDADDLELPTSSLALYINTDHPAHTLLIGAAASSEALAVRETVQSDLARLFLQRALLPDGVVDRTTPWPSGSTGQMLERLLRRTFKGDRRDWPAWREELRRDAARWEARFQAGRRLFFQRGQK
jgi:hypothetical protein